MNGLLSFGVLVALTVGVVEVFKLTGTPKRFLPLTSLVVGFLLNLVGNGIGVTGLTVLAGIAIGLSASGLFDFTKLVRGK